MGLKITGLAYTMKTLLKECHVNKSSHRSGHFSGVLWKVCGS